MRLLQRLLHTIPDGDVLDVVVGIHWTAVIVDAGGKEKCGLASTILRDHTHHSDPDVPKAGELYRWSGLEVAALALSDNGTLSSIGMAAINALIPLELESLFEINAAKVIGKKGKEKKVAVVGSFPFIPKLHNEVGELYVLDQNPGKGEFPADSAPDILPEMDVVAITSMTITNHTFEELISLCSDDTYVILIGPTTPMNPLLFDYGVNLLSGSYVENIPSVIKTIIEGGNFRQVHHAGVKLVNLARENYLIN